MLPVNLAACVAFEATVWIKWPIRSCAKLMNAKENYCLEVCVWSPTATAEYQFRLMTTTMTAIRKQANNSSTPILTVDVAIVFVGIFTDR